MQTILPSLTSKPAFTTQDYINLETTYGANNYHPLDVVLTKGQGVWVWDIEGNQYLDCLSAYSALNQGHCHPRILQAMVEQASKLTLTSRAFYNDQLGLFYQKLSQLSGLPKVLPMNSGAEAVETAIKAIRKWAYTVKGVPANQAEIIVCKNNFAGRTISLISFSTEKQYRFGFAPFTPGFKVIPYGDAAALEAAITANTAAFFLEPIQGEGGIIIPPDGYLREVERICRENNVLLVFDEIQTGLGRTGKMFAFEYEGVKPDGITVGKALSGGFYPISAFVSTHEVMDVFNPGDHGSTFGGNPLAAAVGRAALDVIVDERLTERAAELGDYFISGLREIKSPYVKEVRGRGLLIGVELKPSAGGARRFCKALMQVGILAKETREHIIRFAPPLVITRSQLDWALERIEGVLMAS
ncbi:MAG: ornithine--oxo-acid transaminase [Oscillatoriaceae bacterium SKW80]|nr:ornithine--oxo-acid transaminase [Oscillatoriaceae bacterium SKYG93]MCX8120877.1 ornithine--oxo-acid transaminase [Oscillatoriaceae bacterium SKW80]MDW8452150.1 ornithine--oxo-acid transaminase [Oscillatoriaceae cyanobacterium SKYGB_i_bin93]HIK27360.1 ornithine--oxo-acid transaminase [Oscillatoriaceae cyanobacterium M7585_C2015_266]